MSTPLPTDKQVIFDQVVFTLAKQGHQSIDMTDGTCLYRGPEGRKCAVGILIPDDRYDPLLDSAGAIACVFENEGDETASLGVRLLPEWNNWEMIRFLQCLQAQHDDAACDPVTKEWTSVWDSGGIAHRFSDFALDWGLNSDVVKEAWPS